MRCQAFTHNMQSTCIFVARGGTFPQRNPFNRLKSCQPHEFQSISQSNNQSINHMTGRTIREAAGPFQSRRSRPRR